MSRDRPPLKRAGVDGQGIEGKRHGQRASGRLPTIETVRHTGVIDCHKQTPGSAASQDPTETNHATGVQAFATHLASQARTSAHPA
ncbi:hypothetical protein WOLCODRAFT_150766 [Wolfiporia cocos MD-104 SS10]|uniref:Uncharacterized protein n=1 Tax=Wolfiporia cocos (strain MD-104) TaxID=742152 RepID=A0A2H3JGR0_WOLCO|nr:hypothetical protein WOLCODRAFT_150766 [Wolfiporia cocos MD-104 SS10]